MSNRSQVSKETPSLYLHSMALGKIILKSLKQGHGMSRFCLRGPRTHSVISFVCSQTSYAAKLILICSLWLVRRSL